MVAMKVISKMAMKLAMKKVEKSQPAKAADDFKLPQTLAKVAPKAKAKATEDTEPGDQREKDALNKRNASKFQYALKSMPPARQLEYETILANPKNKAAELKKFKAKFLVHQNWEGAAFQESVGHAWVHEESDEAAWVSYGRLCQLIGEKEAKLAIEHQWYAVSLHEVHCVFIFSLFFSIVDDLNSKY